MENIKAELTAILGESVSHMEQISQQTYAHLYHLYNAQGNSLPILAKRYLCQGIANQEAYKLSLLAREGVIRMPVVYGMTVLSEAPYEELLLLERIPGIIAETLVQQDEIWPVVVEQVIDSLLAWHRIDSGGRVGTVDDCQQQSWQEWYQNWIAKLWEQLQNGNYPHITHDERALLYRSQHRLPRLFAEFHDNAVLVHGNITLRSLLQDAQTKQLIAIVNPGAMLWAPREYDLFRLYDNSLATQLLAAYLARAPVSEDFVARRWLYRVWELVAHYLHTGRIKKVQFEQACQQLSPWLE